jgi:hypothetical protein
LFQRRNAATGIRDINATIEPIKMKRPDRSTMLRAIARLAKGRRPKGPFTRIANEANRAAVIHCLAVMRRDRSGTAEAVASRTRIGSSRGLAAVR